MKEQILKKATRDRFKELIDDWQMFWMNQRQNSEDDYQNYWRRAFGVDANMKHSLAETIAKDPLIGIMAETLQVIHDQLFIESLNRYDDGKIGAAMDKLKTFLG